MKPGDIAIFDDGEKYDLVRIMAESSLGIYYHVSMLTGSSAGYWRTVHESKIYVYSDELIQTLTAKYGYEKKLSNQF